MSSSAILSPTLMSILTISPSAIPSPMSGNLNWKVLDAAGAAGAGAAAGAAAGAEASAGHFKLESHACTSLLIFIKL